MMYNLSVHQQLGKVSRTHRGGGHSPCRAAPHSGQHPWVLAMSQLPCAYRATRERGPPWPVCISVCGTALFLLLFHSSWGDGSGRRGPHVSSRDCRSCPKLHLLRFGVTGDCSLVPDLQPPTSFPLLLWLYTQVRGRAEFLSWRVGAE